MKYQIIKQRGENGRPVVVRTYSNEDDAKQYLQHRQDEIFTKSIYSRTSVRQCLTGHFYQTFMYYYTPTYQTVYLYIKKVTD